MATKNQIRAACDLLRNEIRYDILQKINREGEVSGTDLVKGLRGKCSNIVVHQHIGVCRHAGVIESRQEGINSFYKLNRKHPLTAFIEETLDNEEKVKPGRPRKIGV